MKPENKFYETFLIDALKVICQDHLVEILIKTNRETREKVMMAIAIAGAQVGEKNDNS